MILDYVRCGVWTSCYLVVLELEAVYFRTGQQLIFGNTTVVPILETNKFGLLCPMRIKNQVAELPALHEMTYFTSEIYFLWRYEFLWYQSENQADGYFHKRMAAAGSNCKRLAQESFTMIQISLKDGLQVFEFINSYLAGS